MAAAFDAMEEGKQCLYCTRELQSEGERVFLLRCCMSGAHHACLSEKFPDWHLVTCPKCRCRTRVTAQVLRCDKFSAADSDKIEYCFLKHHRVGRVPMTSKEIEGMRIALNVKGFGAMRHVSHRIFTVGLAFWFPLPKEELCDWEDIVARLSLGLIWNMVSEMRTRYQGRVRRDGRGDGFHHFLDYLMEVYMEADDVSKRDVVVKTCGAAECKECQGFASVFDGQRYTDHVCLANRSHLYDRVERGLYLSFVRMMNKKNTKK